MPRSLKSTMNLIAHFLNWLFEPREGFSSSRDDAYLAAAVDMNDLERRMRQLDRGPSFGPFGYNA